MGFPSLRTIALAVLVAVLVPLLEALSHFDPDAITDWRAWAVGLGRVRFAPLPQRSSPRSS